MREPVAFTVSDRARSFRDIQDKMTADLARALEPIVQKYQEQVARRDALQREALIALISEVQGSP